MGVRSDLLRSAIACYDNGDLIAAADILDASAYPIDHENAVLCRNLAFGRAAHMKSVLGYLLREHLKTAEIFNH